METKIIDIIGLDEKLKIVNLLILDDLKWENPSEHMEEIQQKILKYVAYVDFGHLETKYPRVEGYEIVIKVIFEQLPTDEGLTYIEETKSIFDGSGFQLEFLNYSEL